MLPKNEAVSGAEQPVGKVAAPRLESIDDFVRSILYPTLIRCPGAQRRNGRRQIYDLATRYRVRDFWSLVEGGIAGGLETRNQDHSMTPVSSHQPLNRSVKDPRLHNARARGAVVRRLRRAQSGYSG